jgi:hypothetical protein
MRIGILQPGYLPWLGFFEQIYKSDVFVIYDDVQYDKHGWRNRNRIKTANGIQWLTVPVLSSGMNQPLVRDTRINNSTNWRKKHLASITANYSRALYFNEYINLFQEVLNREWDYLFDLDMTFIELLCRALGIKRKVVCSSELDVSGDKVTRLINICKHFGADVFYEGQAGKAYLDEELFKSEGIIIEYQDYQHPTYQQLYGDFEPYLSVIDLLFNEGPDSLALLVGNYI